MAAVVNCPVCNAKLKLVAPPAAGKKVRCPKCENIFAPQPEKAVAATKAPPPPPEVEEYEELEKPRAATKAPPPPEEPEEDYEEVEEPQPKKNRHQEDGHVMTDNSASPPVQPNRTLTYLFIEAGVAIVISLALLLFFPRIRTIVTDIISNPWEKTIISFPKD